jgi:hypothetical protein
VILQRSRRMRAAVSGYNKAGYCTFIGLMDAAELHLWYLDPGSVCNVDVPVSTARIYEYSRILEYSGLIELLIINTVHQTTYFASLLCNNLAVLATTSEPQRGKVTQIACKWQ